MKTWEIGVDAYFCDGDHIDIYEGDTLIAVVAGRDDNAMERARLIKEAPALYEALTAVMATHIPHDAGSAEAGMKADMAIMRVRGVSHEGD